MPFFKLVMNTGAPGEKNRSAFFEGEFLANGFFRGQKVNKATAEVTHEYNHVDKDGVEHIVTHYIQPGVIKKQTEYFSDLKYGGLTRRTIANQIKGME